MKARTLIVGFALLVVGGAVGYVVGQRGTEAPAPVEKRPERPRAAKIADSGEAASLKALRARVRELEAELAAKAEELKAASAMTNAVAVRPGPWGGDGRREGFRERMERLKTEDPARYSEITNNMAQWRRRSSARQRAKLDFLSSIDTSRMDSAAQTVHRKLQEHIAQREELEQQLQNENLTEAERHELHDQLRENWRQMQAFNGVERKNLIEETARNLGFEGQDVKDISATMKEIIEATEFGFGGGPHHGHGRGGRGDGHPPPPAR